MALFEELASVPIDRMISSMARGIAKAQYDLDLAGIKIAQLMAGITESSRVAFGNKTYSMLELGFTPSFYHFVDTVIEVRVSITITRSREFTTSRGSSTSYDRADDEVTHTRTSSVNASYSNKYQYSAEGSSLMRTKIVPVPAPALLNERILALVEEQKKLAGGTTTEGNDG